MIKNKPCSILCSSRAKLDAQLEALEAENKRLREAIKGVNFTPVLSTQRNSRAVRKGFEMSGSLMHYKADSAGVHALERALEGGE